MKFSKYENSKILVSKVENFKDRIFQEVNIRIRNLKVKNFKKFPNQKQKIQKILKIQNLKMLKISKVKIWEFQNAKIKIYKNSKIKKF